MATRSLAAAPAGVRRIAWTPRDPAGRPLPGGAYFLRVDAAGAHKSVRWVLLK